MNFGESSTSTDKEFFAAPSADIVEYAELGRFEIVADLPGIDEASLDVSVRERELTILARKSAPGGAADGDKEESKEELWNFEVAPRDYRRVFSLNDDVDVDGISASYSSGVLVVDIPKVQKAQPRKINVKVVQ
jgi:HSP20 family protein